MNEKTTKLLQEKSLAEVMFWSDYIESELPICDKRVPDYFFPNGWNSKEQEKTFWVTFRPEISHIIEIETQSNYYKWKKKTTSSCLACECCFNYLFPTHLN